MSRAKAARGSRHGESGLRRPPLAGALACRRSTTALAKESISSPRRDPGHASWEAASTGRASRRQRRTHFQRCTSHAGHSAGRLMPRPPGNGGDEPPPAGTDSRSSLRSDRIASLYGSEIESALPKARRLCQKIISRSDCAHLAGLSALCAPRYYPNVRTL